MKRVWFLFIVVVIALIFFIVGRQPGAAVSTNASLESLLVDDGQTSASFARALIPNDIQFPRDLGPHEDYHTESWYSTGNLQTEEGRPFGYQFTIFRRSLLPAQDMSLLQQRRQTCIL